jgi:hypothetical protein
MPLPLLVFQEANVEATRSIFTDVLLVAEVLPLNYTRENLILWGDRGESNPRVPEPQSGALTTSPRPPYYSR